MCVSLQRGGGVTKYPPIWDNWVEGLLARTPYTIPPPQHTDCRVGFRGGASPLEIWGKGRDQLGDTANHKGKWETPTSHRV